MNLDTIREIYAGAAFDVVFADSRFRILWANHPKQEKSLFGQTALSFLGEDFPLPAESGDYPGTLDGTPVNCRLIRTEYEGEDAYLIEISEKDEVLEAMKIPAVREYLYASSARIREAVFGICGQAKNLYTILEETEHYMEIRYLNLQMGECYRVLKNSLLPAEVIRYAEDGMHERPVSLDEVFEESRKMHEKILNRNGDSVKVVWEKGLTVLCDRERLVRMMLFCELFLLEKGILGLTISAEGNENEIFLTFSPNEGVKPPELEGMFSAAEGSDSGMKNAYLYALRLFCKRFKGELLLSAGEKQALRIRLPRCREIPGESILRASPASYGEDKFTLYHIALGDHYEFPFY